MVQKAGRKSPDQVFLSLYQLGSAKFEVGVCCLNGGHQEGRRMESENSQTQVGVWRCSSWWGDASWIYVERKQSESEG